MVCASFLVVGCDHYTTKMAMMEPSTSNIGSIAPAAGGEMSFSGYLAHEYYELALQEQNINYDYPAAKNYFTKAEQLSDSQMVMLDKVSDYQIDQADQAELIQARQEIEGALQYYAIPENRYNLAKAHSRFDCWLDETEEGKEQSACKVEFIQAMNSLVDVYGYSEEDYFFDFDI